MKIIDYKGEIAAHWKSNKMVLLFPRPIGLSLSLLLYVSIVLEVFCLYAPISSIDFVVDHFDEVRQVNASSVDPLIIKPNDRC